MSWRPPDWKNPDWGYAVFGSGYERGKERHNAHEAGADAMLEALKAGGNYTQSTHIDSDMEGGEGMILTPGWLVFIPDETKGG